MKGYRILLLLFFVSISCYTAVQAAKKVLVTGGAGFIGSHVIEQLLDRGDTVVCMDSCGPVGSTDSSLGDLKRKYTILKQRHLQQIEQKYADTGRLHVYYTDICDASALQDVVAKQMPDVICHLAARAGVRESILYPASYMETNIIGTVNVLEAAKNHGIQHVVLASSSSVYGQSKVTPLSEDRKTEQQSSPYGMSKKALELIAYTYHYLFGMSCTCLRFFTVYGPWGRFDMAPFIFMDALHHEKPITVYGDGTAIRDFTYVGDIVDGIVRAIDTPCGFEQVNLARGEPVALSDFIATIENVVGKKARIQYEKARPADVQITHGDIEKPQRLFGYNPSVSVKDGVKSMYEWYCREFIPLRKRLFMS